MDKTQIEELRKLKTLLNEGIITKEEFNEARDNLLQPKNERNKQASGNLNPDYNHNEESINETPSTQESRDEKPIEEQNNQEPVVSEQADSTNNSGTNNNNNGNKPKGWQLLLVGLIVAFVILFAIASTGAFDEPVDWTYDKSTTKEMSYGDVTVLVPQDWVITDFDDAVQAVYENTVWIMIEDVGKYSSQEKFKKYLESIDASGEDVDLDGCQYAFRRYEYENVDGELILSYYVLVNGNGYWVGGGAKEKSLHKEEFKEMLEHIQYGGK